MEGVVIDTNVFVAAGFNARSASERILAAIGERRLQLVWNEPTRRETEFVLRRIPPLGWDKLADLFRPEGEFTGRVDPHDFVFIEDPDDRKFAALGAAAKVPLVTNDHHLLAHRNLIGFDVLTPRALLTRAGGTLLVGSTTMGSIAPKPSIPRAIQQAGEFEPQSAGWREGEDYAVQPIPRRPGSGGTV